MLEKLTSTAMESGGRRNLLASGARLLAKVGMIFNQDSSFWSSNQMIQWLSDALTHSVSRPGGGAESSADPPGPLIILRRVRNNVEGTTAAVLFR